MAGNDSTAHILQSLGINALIAAAKGVGAWITGSGAMLAETIHSAADCSNQLLLLFGSKSSKKLPTDKHPLGHGRAMYFWSFMVALLIFCGGGVFSVYEGVHKFYSPEPVESPLVGLAILVFAFVLEGGATLSNLKEMMRRASGKSLLKYLTETKDSDLVVVFGENAAATLGVLFAILAQIAAWVTGSSQWDAIGCLCIGVVLIGVALFLAIEVKSLLIGESASKEISEAVNSVVAARPGITNVLHVITLQQGPGQVLLLVKLGFDSSLSSGEICDEINLFEDEVRKMAPEVVWCFVEPDRPR